MLPECTCRCKTVRVLPRAAVTKLSDLTDPQWSADHWLVTAGLENIFYRWEPKLRAGRGLA